MTPPRRFTTVLSTDTVRIKMPDHKLVDHPILIKIWVRIVHVAGGTDSGRQSECAYWFRHIVLQPTTFCNITCKYCYLPNRDAKHHMNPAVTEAIAASLSTRLVPVRCVWHGGEPLSIGQVHFRQLLAPLEDLHRRELITYSIQTNATLIDESWCALFKEYQFEVGLSLDGNREMNAARTLRSGKQSIDLVMRGISRLKEAGIKFSILSVASKENLDAAARLYQFLSSLGPERICINVEEREGLHKGAERLDRATVARFWLELFDAWERDPKVPIREFDQALGWMQSIILGKSSPRTGPRNMWPTIAYGGKIFLISPEFMAIDKVSVDKFCVGNVLHDDLDRVIAGSGQYQFVREFEQGIAECKRVCAYFSYCRGGQASNKYYETGQLNITETDYCRHSKIALVDAVIGGLQKLNSLN